MTKNINAALRVVLYVSFIILITLLFRNVMHNASEDSEEPIMSPIPEAQAHELPDPCGLDTVVCEGEEAPAIRSAGEIRRVSAYNSVPEQTDATPCIGASGDDLCVLYAQGINICASNAFPLGTELHVEGLGDCIVLDRMNRRYPESVDWYMGMDVQAALNWGVRNIEVSKSL